MSLMAYDERETASLKVWMFPLVAWIWGASCLRAGDADRAVAVAQDARGAAPPPARAPPKAAGRMLRGAA